MSTTKQFGERLAPLPLSKERIGKGYRSPSLLDRLRGPRLTAHQRLCAKAERKPGWLYESQRAEPRYQALPDDKLDAAIVQGIAEGWVTPETLADFYGELFAFYTTMMSHAGEARYLNTAREKVESLDAMSLARANPTPENIERAVRELAEDVIVSTAHAKGLQRGTAA